MEDEKRLNKIAHTQQIRIDKLQGNSIAVSFLTVSFVLSTRQLALALKLLLLLLLLLPLLLLLVLMSNTQARRLTDTQRETHIETDSLVGCLRCLWGCLCTLLAASLTGWLADWLTGCLLLLLLLRLPLA